MVRSLGPQSQPFASHACMDDHGGKSEKKLRCFTYGGRHENSNLFPDPRACQPGHGR